MESFIFITYLFWINVIAFWTYAMDKRYAYYSRWRISEAMLLFLAAIGGAFGAGAAMLLFRHKTLHKKFIYTIPVLLFIWTGIILFITINTYTI